MPKRGTTSNAFETALQNQIKARDAFVQFTGKTVTQLPRDLSTEQYEHWTRNGQELALALRYALDNRTDHPPEIDWEYVYFELSCIAGFPRQHKDRNLLSRAADSQYWTVPMLTGLDYDAVSSALRARLSGRFAPFSRSLGDMLNPDGRSPRNRSYLVIVPRSLEADINRNLAGKSPMELDEIIGSEHSMTLLERLLLEFAVMISSDKKLDVRTKTLCLASTTMNNGATPLVSNRKRHQDSTRYDLVLEVSWILPSAAGQRELMKNAGVRRLKDCSLW